MNLLDFLKPEGDYALQDGPRSDIVLSSRVRLARNLSTHPFPESLGPDALAETRNILLEGLLRTETMEDAYHTGMEKLDSQEKQLLVERHLISREHQARADGSAVVISADETISVMVNEEDHLRMQVILPGFQLQEAWRRMDNFDTSLEKRIPYAFSSLYGYLTACPTNLGTGIRVSAMLHLPGLVLEDVINQVINAASKLGMAVRGLYGEGTEAQGNIFQVSNQVTLGESEEEYVEKLHKVVRQIIEQEINTRQKLVETRAVMLKDQIGRAYGILTNCHSINSKEAKNQLSMLRLGVDLCLIDLEHRNLINVLFLSTEPAHLQIRYTQKKNADERDEIRARILRRQLASVRKPRQRGMMVRQLSREER